MGELVIGILFLLLSLIIFWQTGRLSASRYDPLGAAGFPRLIVIIMAVLAVILIIKKLKALDLKSTKLNIKTIIKKNRLVVLTLFNFLLYILVMRYLGFRISTFLFLFGTQMLIGPEDKTGKTYFTITAVSLFISIGSFYFFQNYLGVIFPTGLFFSN